MVPVMYPGNGMSCNGSSPLEMGIGFYKTRGYRYEQEPFTETVTVSGREPSLLERAGRVAMEGIGEAVFGGLLPETVRRNDAALGAVSGSVRGKSSTDTLKTNRNKLSKIIGYKISTSNSVGFLHTNNEQFERKLRK